MACFGEYRILNSGRVLCALCCALAIVLAHASASYSFSQKQLSGLAVNNRISTGDAKQLLVVTNSEINVNLVTLYAYELSGAKWKQVFKPIKVSIGSNGFAKMYEKKEGDKKTPSGIYKLGFAFGYGESVNTKLHYKQTSRNDYWIDDPHSPQYNQMVHKKPDSGSFETLRRNDVCYKYAINVEYNTMPTVSGAGSAIFLHVWRSVNKKTLGCIAMAEANMLRILSWLDANKNPVIALGTFDTLLTLEGAVLAN